MVQYMQCSMFLIELKWMIRILLHHWRSLSLHNCCCLSSNSQFSETKCSFLSYTSLPFLVCNNKAHCSFPPPSSRVVFTLLIPEGPRVLHSWHSDLSPSSVTYYRRLLSPQSFHSKRGSRQHVQGGKWDTFNLKKKADANSGTIFTSKSRITLGYDESVSW